MNKIFKEEIEKSVEVYVDNILVKSPTTEAYIKNLTRDFEIFRKYKIKLNPAKCTFGVEVGNFRAS